MVLYILAVYYVCDNRMGTELVDRWPGYVYTLVQRVTRGIYSGLQSGQDSPAAAD